MHFTPDRTLTSLRPLATALAVLLATALAVLLTIEPAQAGDDNATTCPNAHYHHHGPGTPCHLHLREDDPHRMQPQPPPKSGPDPARPPRPAPRPTPRIAAQQSDRTVQVCYRYLNPQTSQYESNCYENVPQPKRPSGRKFRL